MFANFEKYAYVQKAEIKINFIHRFAKPGTNN